MVPIAGRMYLDLTTFVRYRAARTKLPAAMKIYGPRVATALTRVLDDPRFVPLPGRPFRLRRAFAVTARVAPGLVAGLVSAMARPARARKRAFRAAAEIQHRSHTPERLSTTTERLRFAAGLQGSFMSTGMAEMLPPLYASMIARAAAIGLLRGVATESEVDETLRGMPHNVTTEMDLALWRLAAAAGEHRDLLLNTPPAELAARYLGPASCPSSGSVSSCAATGTGAPPRSTSACRGGPRTRRRCSPRSPATCGSPTRSRPPTGASPARRRRPSRRSTSSWRERARTRPVRARLAGFLLRRSRALAGLRELPKFAWLHAFAEMRRQLLAAGAELHERGLLERADDIMFLDFREALAAAGSGGDELARSDRRPAGPSTTARCGAAASPGSCSPTAPTRRRSHRATPAADGTLVGMAAAPGIATGRARVILDPAGAHVEPGEILVAPTTDPGWTPLFLTAGGLVTETGAAMAHGPTVAREYGIPAVICVRDATQLITTGQLITVDGAAGTVTIAP